MLMSLALRCFRAVLLLLLVSSSCPPPVRCSLSGLSQYAYGTIFSPLFKALSEHGGSRWNPSSKIKPEPKYIKYLTDVFKRTSGARRSLEGDAVYNVVRLIQPQEHCLAKSHKGTFLHSEKLKSEHFTLDLSYSLDRVREKEQLRKVTLLYSSTHINSVCFLSIKEQEHSNKCPLCPGIHQAVNFTPTADGLGRENWVEVDVTQLLLPPSNFPKQNVHLHINVVCPVEKQPGNEGHLEFTVGSPPILLYLHDDSKVSHQTLPPTGGNMLNKQMVFKSHQQVLRAKRRLRRESAKSKGSDKSLDIHLPELLSGSEFPTSYCALYDFRVRFSQLKLDHWIVFPPKYNPRYCRGICPRTIGFIYGSPVHTMVQNIIYEKLDSSVPRPSCIPSHYNPLSVMIFEDGSYTYKEFEDMVATRCTCR